MSDPLINQFLSYVANESGISAMERNAYAKYELVFQPKEVIPKYMEELTALKKSIAVKGAEYWKALEKQAETDARLAALDPKQKLEFIGQRLLPEMNGALGLLNAKYPQVYNFINGNSAKSLSKKIAASDEVDLDLLGAAPKRKTAKRTKRKAKN